MQDDQLKKLLLSEPALKVNSQFQTKIQRQLELLSIENNHVFRSTNNTAIQAKQSKWQYLVIALMLAVTVMILTNHQQTEHADDDLAKLNPMTELTLSTL
jgi:hypothetical protein